MFGFRYGTLLVRSASVAGKDNGYATARCSTVAQQNRVAVSQYQSGAANISTGWTQHLDNIWKVTWSAVLAGQPFRYDPEVVRDVERTLLKQASVGAMVASGQWSFDGSTLYVWTTNSQAPSAANPVSVFDWRHGLEEIVLVNTDGTQKGRLCHHHHHVIDPATDTIPWPSESPDGSRIAFTSNLGGGQDRVMVVLTTPEA